VVGWGNGLPLVRGLRPSGWDPDRVNDDDRPPICVRCGVTMVPVELSADGARDGEWVCLECEELGERE
jgi:hypothetical protein